MPIPDLVLLTTGGSMTRGEGGRLDKVRECGEAGADVTEDVRMGGGVCRVDDKVGTLVAQKTVGGETSNFHGYSQSEGTEVAR